MIYCEGKIHFDHLAFIYESTKVVNLHVDLCHCGPQTGEKVVTEMSDVPKYLPWGKKSPQKTPKLKP